MIYDDVNTKFDVQKGWILPSTTLPRPYEIREVEAKGRGMFATRKIAKGEVIVQEMPLVMVPCSNMYGVEPDLVQLLSWLEPEDREAYFSLHNFSMDFGESDLSSRYAAVCHQISFANHSCYPNAGSLDM
ncbi:uncharacterized protein FOMMEDRAFT_160384 [Fomitiporia mediterranea MF3/22]|uniref:uncharacterized protein n=1 Tax=Fomitiporia mediterranea (strain MF3/22) TaxID=694068 RepID=UPI0004408A3C|nr:uncharacterized protein FOMMEDRAFT_160384 [Fomitiporia mediterranea MF3/22]EJC99910.1 hypothetical protein FOMMEDRAFT_160384 [Fomitiporia mediterranea MF3/22]